jgi:hypothetical protein
MGKGPRLPDIETLMAMGMLPNGTLPNEEIKKILRVNDEQIHCNRFKWFGLPRGLSGNLIERILYYRGQGALFYMEGSDEFVFLPFALKGTIDVYGRYKNIGPVPFNGKSEVDEKDALTKLLSDITAKVVYDPVDFEDIVKDKSMLKGSAVILSDYTRQLPQRIIPKFQLTEPIIDYESRIIPFVNTALANSTGIGGMRVNGQEEQANAELASRQVQYAALTGMKWIPITDALQIQELTGGQVAKAEEFLLTMQSMDNFRLGIHGVENGGLFEKKAHTTNLENSINMGSSGFAIKDALWNRQTFCLIANSLWGFQMWCMPDEISVGMDYSGDGMIGGGADGQMVDGGAEQPAQEDTDNG